MSIKTFVCINCGEKFDYDYKMGQKPLRCKHCHSRRRIKLGLPGDVLILTCIDCGQEFEYVYRGGHPPLRCEYCRPRAKVKYGKAGDVIVVQCVDCGTSFEWVVKLGSRPTQRCPACWEENERSVDAAHYARYYRTPQGREAHFAASLRRRAQEANEVGPTISNAEWRRTLIAFGHHCVYCGCRGPFHRDHFYPLSRGGRTVIGNMVPACAHCNSTKHVSLPEDFLSDEHYQEIVNVLRLLSG